MRTIFDAQGSLDNNNSDTVQCYHMGNIDHQGRWVREAVQVIVRGNAVVSIAVAVALVVILIV